ncbi:MAG: LDL receptor domain-containing protein, partial [Myxococcales bacterium]|nr:LDL receptor domain-containing protein [Myxococcales bacterium]
TGGETESASGSGSASAGTTGGVIDPEVEALCAAAEGSIVEGLTTQCECEVAAGNFADVDACLADLGFDPQVACTCAIMATYPQGPHFECLGPVTADFATCMKTTGCDDLDALDLCFFTLLDAGDCPDSDQAAEAQVRFECYGDAPFACGSGETIPETWVCDLDDNCADGSDESRCPVFMCKSGDEIPLEWQCDGAADCPDGDDEENCP